MYEHVCKLFMSACVCLSVSAAVCMCMLVWANNIAIVMSHSWTTVRADRNILARNTMKSNSARQMSNVGQQNWGQDVPSNWPIWKSSDIVSPLCLHALLFSISPSCASIVHVPTLTTSCRQTSKATCKVPFFDNSGQIWCYTPARTLSKCQASFFKHVCISLTRKVLVSHCFPFWLCPHDGREGARRHAEQ